MNIKKRNNHSLNIVHVKIIKNGILFPVVFNNIMKISPGKTPGTSPRASTTDNVRVKFRLIDAPAPGGEGRAGEMWRERRPEIESLTWCKYTLYVLTKPLNVMNRKIFHSI